MGKQYTTIAVTPETREKLGLWQAHLTKKWAERLTKKWGQRVTQDETLDYLLDMAGPPPEEA